jgi:hypothetical protein
VGFNRRKMEDQRRHAVEKEAAAHRATDAQVLEDAERLLTAWNERQAKRMPMLFSPTIGAAQQGPGAWCQWQVKMPSSTLPRSSGKPMWGQRLSRAKTRPPL